MVLALFAPFEGRPAMTTLGRYERLTKTLNAYCVCPGLSQLIIQGVPN
jgi:hypothetical protein